MCVEKVIKNINEHFLESLFLRGKGYICPQNLPFPPPPLMFKE